jgi:hypothetical protein
MPTGVNTNALDIRFPINPNSPLFPNTIPSNTKIMGSDLQIVFSSFQEN